MFIIRFLMPQVGKISQERFMNTLVFESVPFCQKSFSFILIFKILIIILFKKIRCGRYTWNIAKVKNIVLIMRFDLHIIESCSHKSMRNAPARETRVCQRNAMNATIKRKPLETSET